VEDLRAGSIKLSSAIVPYPWVEKVSRRDTDDRIRRRDSWKDVNKGGEEEEKKKKRGKKVEEEEGERKNQNGVGAGLDVYCKRQSTASRCKSS